LGKEKLVPVICNYCGKHAKRVYGSKIYPNRPDLKSLVFFECEPCDARVGTHKNSLKPLGRLANSELRAARSLAHEAFDPIWRHGQMHRNLAYQWLADTLGISRKKCHIAMFDLDLCNRTIELCRELRRLS
jgi:hypothetical protein